MSIKDSLILMWLLFSKEKKKKKTEESLSRPLLRFSKTILHLSSYLQKTLHNHIL